MTENLKESSKTQEKKNVFTKIKENLDDKEEQLAIVGGFVRLGVLVWSGFFKGIISADKIVILEKKNKLIKNTNFFSIIF